MQLVLHVSVRTRKSQLNILQTMLRHFRHLKEFFDKFHRKSNSFLYNIKIYSPVETCYSYLIAHLFVSRYGERSEVFLNQSEIKPHNPSTQLEETNAEFQQCFIFKWTGTNILYIQQTVMWLIDVWGDITCSHTPVHLNSFTHFPAL